MIGSDLAKAAELLSEGKLVAIPTETVYGLAANALSPSAVSTIYEVKNRPHFNPLILHISKIDEASKYVTDIPSSALKLMKAFWPGSLSILLPKNECVPDIITAGSPYVVLRVPNHPLTLELLRSLDFPLAAPSANKSNSVSPTRPEDVLEELQDGAPYILDGGECTIGLESTIVKIVDDKVVILREGGISREDILTKTGLEIITEKNTKIQS